MNDIMNTNYSGASDPYEKDGNAKLEHELEKAKPRGEQDRIDEKEKGVPDKPEERDEENNAGENF